MIGSFLRRVVGSFEKRALVISYHRVSEDLVDPWNLVVSPRNFERQLEHLWVSWNPVSLESLVTGIETGRLKSKSVALCFDDAYLEHFVTVKPLLERFNIPATFFVPSQNVFEQRPYWWKELMNLVLYSRHLPSEINMKIGDSDFHFAIGRDTVFTEKIRQQYTQWKMPSAIPNKRAELFVELWNRLRSKSFEEIETVIRSIRNLISVPPQDLQRQLMNVDELKAISESPLFSLGLQAHSNLMLADQNKENQKSDLLKNAELLHSITGKQATFLAYPSGEFNSDTLEVASSLGIRAGFTSREEPISSKSELLNLGSVSARNINWQQFGRHLKSVKNK